MAVSPYGSIWADDAYIVGEIQCWESQIFFLLRKAQIRNENWIRLLRIRKVRKCKAFAPQ